VSIPEVGSSKNTILEPPINDIPRDNFLFYPPERAFANLFFSPSVFVVSNTYETSLSNSAPKQPLI